LHVPVSTSKVTILAEQSCRTGWNYRAASGRVHLPRAVQLPFCRHGMSVFMDAFIYNIQVCIYICVDTCVYMKKYLLFQLLRAVQMPFCRRSMPVFMDACVCNLDVCIYTYVYYINTAFFNCRERLNCHSVDAACQYSWMHVYVI